MVNRRIEGALAVSAWSNSRGMSLGGMIETKIGNVASHQNDRESVFENKAC